MTSPPPQRILVALEDSATAGVVATAAVPIAIERDASEVVLLHVTDTYTLTGGLLNLSAVTVPVAETADERRALFALAEAAIRAEYAALEKPVPAISERMSAGTPAGAIAQVAKEIGAAAIVLGARRPHAFGRLVHPDVRSTLAGCTTIPVQVVPLQAGPGG